MSQTNSDDKPINSQKTKSQAYDKETMTKYLSDGIYPSKLNKEQKKYLRNKTRDMRLIGGKLHQKNEKNGPYKIVFYEGDINSKKELIMAEHNKAHFRSEKMYERINNIAIGISRKEIRDVLKGCENCQIQTKIQTYKAITAIVAKHVFHRFQMDLMCMTTYADINENFKYILVVIDCYLKYIWTFPLLSKEQTGIERSLKNIFNLFSPPKILQSDNGKEFKNVKINELCQEYKIVFVHGRPRKPTTQRQVERSNGTLKSSLSKILALDKNKTWINELDRVVLEYNTTIHSSHFKTPKQVMFNNKCYNTEPEYECLQQDLTYLETIENELSSEIETVRTNYVNKMVLRAKNHSKSWKFEPGDIVLLRNDFDNNLKTKNKGLDTYHQLVKYTVVETNDKDKITIMANDEKKIVNSSQITPFF
ncbi:Pro-Pol polyprotein [Cucumispora dikerogammari]|nr:Pro-Pol polyprotein [Cucumispora dikerogammari]